jgi:hypothetical protein
VAMKSASDQLRDDVERNEARSKWAAWVLVAGLVIEVVLAFNFSEGKTPLEHWSPVLADIMVALGVFGEIHFSGKAARAQKALQSIIDGKLTEALERAAKAQEDLIKFRTPRADLLTTKALGLVIQKIAPFAGTKFDIGHDDLDREVWDFLWKLEPALSVAGWVHVNWVGGNTFPKMNWPGNHQYGLAGVTNISIEVHPAFRSALLPAADALADALRAIEIDVHNDNNNSSQNDDAIHFLVGPKR